ncbi:MAG: type II secretion system F family protein [Planctomycetota bacterium]|nr:type II secretion system F family protein [Planctomycetota bacterium]
MPTFQFQAMDATGQEIRDFIEAATEEEAQSTIRQMGYYVTSIKAKRGAAAQESRVGRKKKPFGIGGGGSKKVTAFTRQLSILQDAGLPILKSLQILEDQSKPGSLKNALIDTCEEIESGATLSEAMAKCPRTFDRLYVNMIKAGEAGGAMELILQRLADFMERSQSLKRKVIGAMIYPCFVVGAASLILTGIMIWIVPTFQEMFEEFDLELPAVTQLLIAISEATAQFWYLIPLLPLTLWLFVKLIRKFRHGRMGWDIFILRLPVVGSLIEKNIMARTSRTLGTLVASGVPILEALNITRETAGNGKFEYLYSQISDAIREGETMAVPMKAHSRLGFHVVATFFWFLTGAVPGLLILVLAAIAQTRPEADTMEGKTLVFMLLQVGGGAVGICGVLAVLVYFLRMGGRVVDDIVVNMVDVGEQTGELDTMLYKVADVFDEEVKVMTDGLMALLEPLLIIFLGGAVGFIVVALFMPLIDLITNLTGGV